MLIDKIKNIDTLPLHMPGHKRNILLLGQDLPYDIDITEIEGFDNLHSPKGILLDINNKINDLYKSKSSYALVNGSTVGILAAVCSLINEGDKVLLARNCHKSVYNAVELSRAAADYILPDYDEYGVAKGITVNQVREKLSDDTGLIILTSPTYEGVVSDVDGICELAHKNGTAVLVDAAHGAHQFDYYHNADIVIRGLHKTLPALTQCAVANIYGDLAVARRFEERLSIFESSSPSYILLSSIEKCIDVVSEQKLFDEFDKNISCFQNINLKNLKLLRYDDNCKINIFTGYTDISGFELSDILRNEFKIETEMACQSYITAIATVCDTKENLERFKNALESIDSRLTARCKNTVSYIGHPKKFCEASQAKKESEAVILSDSEGRVSSEYIWAYPPGVPLIVPGEIIDSELLSYIKNYLGELNSTSGLLPQKIYCKKV